MSNGWVDCLSNPESIRAAFGAGCEPSLSQVEIVSFSLNHQGPCATIRVQLNEYPKNPPTKWVKQGCSRVLVDLAVVGLVRSQLDHWSTQNRVDLVVQKNPHGNIEIGCSSEACSFSLEAYDLRIDAFHPY